MIVCDARLGGGFLEDKYDGAGKGVHGRKEGLEEEVEDDGEEEDIIPAADYHPSN